MLLASKSSDSIRARSPLAAMAVMGSMREGKGTARANRGLEDNCLKKRRILPKRRTGKNAVGGKSLPEMAWRPFFCRAIGDQLLENAHLVIWQASCNSRCVAALAVPASLLSAPARVSTPGHASRLTADAMPDAEAAGADDGPFPELLAGMVAANAKARGDAPAGIETMPGLTLPAAHEENAALVAGATAPAGKRSAAGRLAMGHAGSRERSAAASKLRMPGANGPEPDTGNRRSTTRYRAPPPHRLRASSSSRTNG